jgi:hypothetical protein
MQVVTLDLPWAPFPDILARVHPCQGPAQQQVLIGAKAGLDQDADGR